MEAAPGDYDGDGNEDLGVYDRAYGMWHILFLPRGNEWSGSFFGGTVCETKATPVPADYDGDGATDLALYWMGYWFICYSRTWATLEVEPFGTIFVVEPFAERGMPVMGDWDGDGITEMGVYANGIWTLRLGNGDVVVQEFGGWESGVWPAPGDYDGDGATDLGVHNYIANEWRWRSSWTGFTSTNSFGPCGGRPMQGYFDHDRNEDFAQTFIWAHDFVVWLIKRTDERPDYPYLYQGQSYQLSTDTWLVSW